MRQVNYIYFNSVESIINSLFQVIKTPHNSKEYIQELKNKFILWAKYQIGQKAWVWQQNNAFIHILRMIMNFLKK